MQDSWLDGSPDVIVVKIESDENDNQNKRALYLARRSAQHAVVAIVPENSAGKRTEEYLSLCAGTKPREFRVSKSEDILAAAFEKRGLTVERQVPMGRYLLDFLIRDIDWDTAVEVDGKYWHTDKFGNRKPDDLWRDNVLATVGIHTVRIWANEVDMNPEHAVEHALRAHKEPNLDEGKNK